MPTIPTFSAAMPFGAGYQSGINAVQMYNDEKIRQQARDEAEDSYKRELLDNDRQKSQLQYMMHLDGIAKEKVAQDRETNLQALKQFSDTYGVTPDLSNPEHKQALSGILSTLKGVYMPSANSMQENAGNGIGSPQGQPPTPSLMTKNEREQKKAIRQKAFDAVKATGAKIGAEVYSMSPEEADTYIMQKMNEAKQSKQDEKSPNLKQVQIQNMKFAQKAEQANSYLESIEKSGWSPANTAAGLEVSMNKFIPEMIKPENLKKFNSASWMFLNTVLRDESGAAIPESEYGKYIPIYIPQPGDSKEVLKMKANNRKLAIEGFRTGSLESAPHNKEESAGSSTSNENGGLAPSSQISKMNADKDPLGIL